MKKREEADIPDIIGPRFPDSFEIDEEEFEMYSKWHYCYSNRTDTQLIFSVPEESIPKHLYSSRKQIITRSHRLKKYSLILSNTTLEKGERRAPGVEGRKRL